MEIPLGSGDTRTFLDLWSLFQCIACTVIGVIIELQLLYYLNISVISHELAIQQPPRQCTSSKVNPFLRTVLIDAVICRYMNYIIIIMGIVYPVYLRIDSKVGTKVIIVRYN